MSRIVFTALGPTFSEQAQRLGLVATGKPFDVVDKIAHALAIAHIHGVLTDTEVERARTRLIWAAKLRQIEPAKD